MLLKSLTRIISLFKGRGAFKLDPVRYRARVDRLQADLMTATHNIKTLRAQLTEAQANTTRVSAERDRLFKNYQRYLKGSRGGESVLGT